VAGGIPARTHGVPDVNPPGGDATSTIQAAVDACPAGQVVQLSAGTFTITRGNYVLLNKGITLRGAGPGQTTLQKTERSEAGLRRRLAPTPRRCHRRAGPLGQQQRAVHQPDCGRGQGAELDHGGQRLRVQPGQIVLLDELSGASWQPDPAGEGRSGPPPTSGWSTSAQPLTGTDDPFPDAAGWFSRQDRRRTRSSRSIHITGTPIFFNTPIHISYRSLARAQLTAFSYTTTRTPAWRTHGHRG
jgi:hypothetical protein